MIVIDFSSKRAQLAVRFFSYGVMAALTVSITTLLVFYAMGYRLGTDFKFAQGGLVQFNSFPSGATVTVDGKQENFTTAGNANLTAGQHEVNLSLKGYDTWRKTISLSPGQLLWLSYVRLIPSKIVTTAEHEFDSLANVVPSPDKRWFLLQPTASAPGLVLADISNPSQPKFSDLQLPDSALAKTNNSYGTITITEWSQDSRYILLRQQIGTTVSFVRLDRTQPSSAVNISNLFGFTIQDAHFSGNANVIFADTGGILRKLDLGNNSASDALVDHLQQFTMLDGGDKIAYVTQTQQTASGQTTSTQTVGVWQNNKATPARVTAAGAQPLLAYSNYEGHDYLVIATSNSSRIDILRDPDATASKDQTAVFAQLDLGVVPKSLSFSPGGRMVFAQNGNQLAVFDFENAKGYQTAFPGTKVTAALHWLDDFYLWGDAGGTLKIAEFDGLNSHDIVAVQPGFGATLDTDGKNILSIGVDAKSGKYVLQDSQLTVSN